MAASATVATRIPYSGSWRSRSRVLRVRSLTGARTAVNGVVLIRVSRWLLCRAYGAPRARRQRR